MQNGTWMFAVLATSWVCSEQKKWTKGCTTLKKQGTKSFCGCSSGVPSSSEGDVLMTQGHTLAHGSTRLWTATLTADSKMRYRCVVGKPKGKSQVPKPKWLKSSPVLKYASTVLMSLCTPCQTYLTENGRGGEEIPALGIRGREGNTVRKGWNWALQTDRSWTSFLGEM